MRRWRVWGSILVAVVMTAACAERPFGPGPRTAGLTVENPHGYAITIRRVNGDSVRDESARTIEGTYVAGAWVVRVETERGVVEYGAPLFPDLRGGDAVKIVAAAAPRTNDAAWRWIPAGPALIGDSIGVGQEDERPAEVCEVDGFFMAGRETTNAEFAAFLNATKAIDPAWCAFDSLKFRCRRGSDAGFTTDAPDLPVVTVSLAGARAYARWKSETTGVAHRLPTEVEWEKAARGPESTVFAYGDVYRRDAANQESGTLKAVGLYAANGFGLYDMTGNAFEWTNDAYRRDRTAPTNTEKTPDREPDQALRGGSFVLDGMYLRNSFRMRQRPSVRTDDIGFRLVREATEAERKDVR